MNRRRIIIDTDIGDDVDDLLALALAIREPSLELAGITTVYRNTPARAAIAAYFLRELAGLPHIPIHAGAEQPLAGECDATELPCQYHEEMAGFAADSTDAVGFLRAQLEQAPATLVCIAPLTNIALLLEAHPEIASRIESLVIMGGCYFSHACEWNITADPEAAAVVFDSGVPIRAVGLDVTTRCSVTEAQLASIDATIPANAFLLRACRDWQQASSFLPVLHDPLTIYSLLPESDLSFQAETIRIELSGTHTRGMTWCEPHRLWGREPGSPNAEIAVDLNVSQFLEHFMNRVFNVGAG